jgi:uncharacterized membrane protein
MQPIQTMNAKKMYPISVEYVFETEYERDDKTIKLIWEYCDLMGITFRIRKYDSLTILEDKTLVEKLPAVHIYIKNVHAKITYPDKENPLDALCDIRTVYSKFDIEYMAYLAKRQIWNERLLFLKRIFVRDSSKTDLTSSKHIS